MNTSNSSPHTFSTCLSPGHISLSVMKQTAQQLHEESDRIFAQAYMVVCHPNDLAAYSLTDAMERLEQSPFFRQGVKLHAKRAVRAMREYEKRILSHLAEHDRGEYFMDSCDEFFSLLKKHVFIMRMTIKQALDDRHSEHSELASYLLTALNMLQIAVVNYDSFWKDMIGKPGGLDIERFFTPARLQGVLSEWWSAVEALPFTLPRDVLQDENVEKAIRVILIKLSDVHIYNAAGEASLSLHPELEEEANRNVERLK